MGVLTNINGLDNNPIEDGGYCGGAIFGLVATPMSGFFGDVYGNILPRDAISGINGITSTNPADIQPGGDPFGTACLWHKVRYNGPFAELSDACLLTNSEPGATEARVGTPPKFMLVHAKAGGGNPVPSEDMWYVSTSVFSKSEWIGVPPVVSFPDNGYYILWGKYGIDDSGSNFKAVEFLNNNTPAQVSVKGTCSF
tara:strand:+ start:1595 stop:2185 length:591 start_codon:yes stop_codon:yes gene_type:complete